MLLPPKRCYSLHSKEIQVGEDGMDEACRWCALEGDLICCDFCHNVFCKLCIRRNLGRAHLNIILNAEEDQKWQCYVCNSEPLVGLVASCSEILKSAEDVTESKAIKRLVGLSDLSDEASVGSSPKPKRTKKSKITVDNDESTSAIKNDELEGTVSEKDEINENCVYNDDEEEEEEELDTNNIEENEEEEENEDLSEDNDLKQILDKIDDAKDKPVEDEANAEAADKKDDIIKQIDKIIKSASKGTPSSTTVMETKTHKNNDGEVVYIKTPTGEIVGLKATSKSLKSINSPIDISAIQAALKQSASVGPKRPKGRPRMPDRKSDKYPLPSSTGKKYPRTNFQHKNTPSSLAAVAGLKLSSRPPHIDQNNVWNVLERLLAATQSMTMLLTSLKDDLKRAAAVSSGFSGPGKVPDLKKKKKEVAVKLWRAFLAYKKSFIDIEVYTKKKKARLEAQLQKQQQKLKIAKEFLGDDIEDENYAGKEFGDDEEEEDLGELLDENYSVISAGSKQLSSKVVGDVIDKDNETNNENNNNDDCAGIKVIIDNSMKEGADDKNDNKVDAVDNDGEQLDYDGLKIKEDGELLKSDTNQTEIEAFTLD